MNIDPKKVKSNGKGPINVADSTNVSIHKFWRQTVSSRKSAGTLACRCQAWKLNLSFIRGEAEVWWNIQLGIPKKVLKIHVETTHRQCMVADCCTSFWQVDLGCSISKLSSLQYPYTAYQKLIHVTGSFYLSFQLLFLCMMKKRCISLSKQSMYGIFPYIYPNKSTIKPIHIGKYTSSSHGWYGQFAALFPSSQQATRRCSVPWSDEGMQSFPPRGSQGVFGCFFWGGDWGLPSFHLVVFFKWFRSATYTATWCSIQVIYMSHVLG